MNDLTMPAAIARAINRRAWELAGVPTTAPCYRQGLADEIERLRAAAGADPWEVELLVGDLL